MPIELKGLNYYSKVFKRINYRLSNSTFWVVITKSIEHLIIDLDDMSEGSIISAGARAGAATGDSSYWALDDSPRVEVLALLAEGRLIELWGLWVVPPSVVAALLISYLRWGGGEEGIMGTPPSVGGIWGHSTIWDGATNWARVEETLCLGELLCIDEEWASWIFAIEKIGNGAKDSRLWWF